MNGEKDRYNGITIDLKTVPINVGEDEFRKSLTDALKQWRLEKRSAIWLKVPIMHSKFIAIAAEQGFEFHHAEHQNALLKIWLDESEIDTTPRFATHQVGVSGFVFREDTGEVLVVKDNNRRFHWWKLPGGLSDLGEDIGDTAEREVFEETGVKAEFVSILALRQQHLQPGAFGRSDIYIVCRLRPLSFELNPCEKEIKACQWMNLEELHNHKDITPITKRITTLALHGLHNGFDTVDITKERFKSVYKGLEYYLYHRNIGNL